MKRKITFKYLIYSLLLFFSSQKIISQCFEIESILVAACISSPGTEGYNEMVRFKVGAVPINTGTLTVNWPAQTWQGLVQNATTASKVSSINADIALAGGCGQLIEPTAGILPANAEVVLVTSQNFSATANVFGAITQNIYIIFQDNTTVFAGHFGNYSVTPGLRTLSMSFGACFDSATYERSLLANGPGATVNFTPSGVASYTNPGCVAPVETFSVDAGTTPVNACPGQTISLSGTAVGSTSVAWTAPSGSFSAPASLNTNYTLSASASGNVVLTLSATNTCGNDITDTVTVNVSAATTPTFNAVSAICSGAALSALPTTSTNGITGSWSPALNNTLTTLYTFTPNTGQCATTATLTITVNPNVTPAFNAVAAICSGATLSPLPTTSTNGITGSWSPALNNTATTVYTFTPNSGQCATTATLTITVNPNNITPTFNPVAAICSGATLSPLPTTSTNGVTGSWSPALNNTATTVYTFTPNSGQCATTATLTITVNPNNITPTFNPVAAICSGATLSPLLTTSTNGVTGSWSPALNNTATTTYTFTPNSGQCASIATLSITVNANNVVPTFNPVPAICSGAALSPLPTTSNNGITGSWSPALNNTSTTLYTFTPNSGQCAANATLTIAVNPIVTPTFNGVAPICSGETLAPLPTTSINGITGVWSPALNNSATTLYTFTPNTGQCATSKTLTIVVNPGVVPTFTGINQLVCPGDVLPPLPTVSANGITGTWSPALNSVVTTLYTFTPNAGQCAVSASLGITVNNGIIPIFDAATIPVFICYGTAITPLPTTSMNGITGTWSPALSNTQTETYTFTPNPGQCAVINRLTINVTNPVTKNEAYFICVDAAGNAITNAPIDSGLSSAQYSFAWTLNGASIPDNTSSITASASGTYTLEATNTITGCVTYTLIAEVKGVVPATATISSTGDFAEGQQIVVNISGGLSSYEYQLNGGPYQTSNTFNVYEGGEYTVHVKDNLGCNEFDLQITILNYPKFFTPNGDGYNDTWNIQGLLPSNNAALYIFDRYGKLLKQISPNGIGWDGIANGHEMPATDYWFKLLYLDRNGISKEFKSHFALKR